MLRVSHDPEQRRQMRPAARRAVEERFTMHTMMNCLIDTYDELLAAKYV
jgi:glycosyltransferase involved in cell wall biosynthesis